MNKYIVELKKTNQRNFFKCLFKFNLLNPLIKGYINNYSIYRIRLCFFPFDLKQEILYFGGKYSFSKNKLNIKVFNSNDKTLMKFSLYCPYMCIYLIN